MKAVGEGNERAMSIVSQTEIFLNYFGNIFCAIFITVLAWGLNINLDVAS